MMLSARSRRWKSGSAPAAICASSQVRRVHPCGRLPVELHQGGGAVGRHQPERVDAETLHRAVRARDGAVGHDPHEHVGGLGVQRHEIPERVVCRLRLRDLDVRMWLRGVDDVRELDAVLDEEHRDVVPDQVEGALGGVELRREAAHVANSVSRPARTRDGGEPDEHRGLGALGQERGPGQLRGGAVRREDTVSAGATGVDDTLRDALVVEVRDLLAEVEILQERRPALPRLQRVISVRQAHSVCRGQPVTGLGAPTAHAVAGGCRGTGRPYRSRCGLVCRAREPPDRRSDPRARVRRRLAGGLRAVPWPCSCDAVAACRPSEIDQPPRAGGSMEPPSCPDLGPSNPCPATARQPMRDLCHVPSRPRHSSLGGSRGGRIWP